MQLTLAITPEELRLTGGPEHLRSDSPHPGRQAARSIWPSLSERFKELKEQFPDQSAITLQTDDKVRYDVLVRIIDECWARGCRKSR